MDDPSRIFGLEVLEDMRKFNSCGGHGGGSSKFDVFFEKCKQILHSDAGSHERIKVADEYIIYALTVTSIEDLARKVLAAFQNDADRKIIEIMPPIPCLETVRLDFFQHQGR